SRLPRSLFRLELALVPLLRALGAGLAHRPAELVTPGAQPSARAPDRATAEDHADGHPRDDAEKNQKRCDEGCHLEVLSGRAEPEAQARRSTPPDRLGLRHIGRAALDDLFALA